MRLFHFTPIITKPQTRFAATERELGLTTAQQLSASGLDPTPLLHVKSEKRVSVDPILLL